MSQSQIVLYNYFRSSPSYRVRIALYHKDLEFEYRTVHLLNHGGEHRQLQYTELNPQQEVPTLVHLGRPISQSLAIMEYLEETFPQNPLLPKGLYERARVRQFSENINSYMHPICNLKVLQYLESKHGYDQTQKELWIQHWATRGFWALETMLKASAGRFCFGDQLTMADLCLIPQIFSAERFQVDLEPFPTVRRINATCLKLEPFQKAHPARQPDSQ